MYVNKKWIESNPIPPDESRWGIFNALRKENIRRINGILEELMKENGADPKSIHGKLRTFYLTGMDEKALNKAGVYPIEEDVASILVARSVSDLLRVVAKLHVKGASPFFGTFVEPDLKNSSMNIFWLYQSGIGLPDRDYYTKDDVGSMEIREGYKLHVKKMFELAGWNDLTSAEVAARTIMDIETRLAKASMTGVERRNPEIQYNKMTVTELADLAPSINWSMYFDEIGAPKMESLNVAQPLFIKEVSAILSDTPLPLLKTYLMWHILHHTASQLGDVFVNEEFDFYGRQMSGAKELKPRSERCAATLSGLVGQALGELYVERYFPLEAKEKIMKMCSDLVDAFKKRIEAVTWMTDETKVKALEKLSRVTWKIGYPDKWHDYSSLEIQNDSYAKNIMRACAFEHRRAMEKIDKPVDRSEWMMSPQTVNAYYNPAWNEMVFPAGILQPPYFDAESEDALNYGAILVVIGHELTHGFDDTGSTFDADGNMNNWWTPEDALKFKEKTKVVIDQASAYVVIDDLHLNGELTVGENIADLGGVSTAFDAFKRAHSDCEGNDERELSPAQRFFAAYARVWRGHMTKEAVRERIITDPHAPPAYRTNNPLSNLPEFYRAFKVGPEHKLFRRPEEQAKVW